MKNNQKKNIIAFISAGFLFLALLDGWAYDFFTIMRWIVCATCFFIAWMCAEEDKDGWAWAFGLLGILFNPIFIIHLSRSAWTPIDFIVGIFLVASIFFIKLEK